MNANTKDLIALRQNFTRPANTDAYAVGDAISAVTTDAHFTFGTTFDAIDGSNVDECIFKSSLGKRCKGATLEAIQLHSSRNTLIALVARLYIFNLDFTNTADNAAFAPSAHLMRNHLLGYVDIAAADWRLQGSNVAMLQNLNIPLVNHLDHPDDDITGQLYIQLVAQSTYTPASGERFDLTLILDRN